VAELGLAAAELNEIVALLENGSAKSPPDNA